MNIRGTRERIAGRLAGFTGRPAWGIVPWLALAFYTAAAIVGSHHPDERGQISAFLAFKLGVQPQAHMPWDFGFRMRPWFQPAFYYALAAPLKAVIGYRYWAVERLILLVQPVLLTAAAFWSRDMWRPRRPTAPSCERRTSRASEGLAPLGQAPSTGRPDLLSWGQALVGCTWFLPAMLVRHSSEAFSCIWLLFALGSWHRLESSSRDGRPPEAFLGMLAGLAAGLAFWSRFQTGFFTAGFWMTRLAVDLKGERRILRPLLWFALGTALTMPLGAALDAWGYGAPAFSPWSYFRENILHGRASIFGVEPWHWYALVGTCFTLNPLFCAWLGLAAFRLRRSPWYAALAGGIGLFLAVHLAVPHKEMRFLAPAFVAALPLLLGLFEDAAASPPSTLLTLSGLTPSYVKAVALLNAAALAVVTLTGLVQAASRAELALWRLPPGLTVLSRTPLYASFGLPFASMTGQGQGSALPCPRKTVTLDRSLAGDGLCPMRDAFTFAMPPGLTLRYCTPAGLAAECAKTPGALVLLTSADRAMNTLVAEPWPVVDSFPPSWMRPDAWPPRLKHGVYSFKIVRCADFAHHAIISR